MMSDEAKMMFEDASVRRERARIEDEYRRREREVDAELYAPWSPPEIFMRDGRRRAAAMLLHRAGVFPRAGDSCLEVGYGKLGWCADLINWGVREADLHGIELDGARAEQARAALPLADLRVGDAAQLPWATETFKLVVVSTVFTSILDWSVRALLAREIARVLAPGGALLWYDFAVNNPRNREVSKVSRGELRELFPSLRGEIKRVTLAPPLARLVCPRSWSLATLLEALPMLRTHLLAVLIKPSSSAMRLKCRL